MVSLKQKDTFKEDKIHEILKSRGELNIVELVKLSDQTYWQVRRSLEKLMKDGRVIHSNTIGKAFYFMAEGSTALPSYNTGKGFTPLPALIDHISKTKFFKAENNDIMNRALVTIFAQPIYAQARNAIDEQSIDTMKKELATLRSRMENALTLITDLQTRGLHKEKDLYRGWYSDKDYNAALAYKLYLTVFPNSSGAMVDCYNLLGLDAASTPVGDSNE